MGRPAQAGECAIEQRLRETFRQRAADSLNGSRRRRDHLVDERIGLGCETELFRERLEVPALDALQVIAWPFAGQGHGELDLRERNLVGLLADDWPRG